MIYWTLGLSAHFAIGTLFLLSGPSSRLRKVESKHVRLRNRSAPEWKFFAFDCVLAAIILSLWPVVSIVTWQHERVEGRAADPSIAMKLAHETLLEGAASPETIKKIASVLEDSLMTYSTYELAVMIALTYYKQASPDELARFAKVQSSARISVLEWAERKRIRAGFAIGFERSLYKMFGPECASERGRS